MVAECGESRSVLGASVRRSEEEASSGLGIEEGLVFRNRELEVAIDIASFAEPQVQDLLFRVVRDRREHLRFER